jgi:hypothetical protein
VEEHRPGCGLEGVEPEPIINSMTGLASETTSDGISGDDHPRAERAFLMGDEPGYARRLLMLSVT